jgi:hypothetical protein
LSSFDNVYQLLFYPVEHYITIIIITTIIIIIITITIIITIIINTITATNPSSPSSYLQHAAEHPHLLTA